MIDEKDRALVQKEISEIKDAIALKRAEIKQDEADDKSKVLAFHDPKNGPLGYENPAIKSRYLVLASLEDEINIRIEAINHNLDFQQISVDLIKRSAKELKKEYESEIEKI